MNVITMTLLKDLFVTQDFFGSCSKLQLVGIHSAIVSPVLGDLVALSAVTFQE
jgi:hypothetical protein